MQQRWQDVSSVESLNRFPQGERPSCPHDSRPRVVVEQKRRRRRAVVAQGNERSARIQQDHARKMAAGNRQRRFSRLLVNYTAIMRPKDADAAGMRNVTLAFVVPVHDEDSLFIQVASALAHERQDMRLRRHLPRTAAFTAMLARIGCVQREAASLHGTPV